jgi:chromosome segregation ATPase
VRRLEEARSAHGALQTRIDTAFESDADLRERISEAVGVADQRGEIINMRDEAVRALEENVRKLGSAKGETEGELARVTAELKASRKATEEEDDRREEARRREKDEETEERRAEVERWDKERRARAEHFEEERRKWALERATLEETQVEQLESLREEVDDAQRRAEYEQSSLREEMDRVLEGARQEVETSRLDARDARD